MTYFRLQFLLEFCISVRYPDISTYQCMTLARAICVCYGAARGHTSYGLEMRTWNNKGLVEVPHLYMFHLWQRTTSTLEHYGTLWQPNANQSLPKVRSQHKMMVFLYSSFYALILLCWQYWCLTNLHIPMSILLTVVTRTTTENPLFCVLKANQER